MMWQTQAGETIFVPSGGLEKLIPQLKRTNHLWYAAIRQFRGSLRPTLLRLLGFLARRAMYRQLHQAADGNTYKKFETQFGERVYEIWTRPSGALVALRLRQVDDDFEFEGEPGPSANNVHEQLVGQLRDLFTHYGYEVRVDKGLGQKKGEDWNYVRIPNKGKKVLRPDIQITDPITKKTVSIEVDSKWKNSVEHQKRISQAFPGQNPILIEFRHRPGASTFTSNGNYNLAEGRVRELLLKHLGEAKKDKTWDVFNLFDKTVKNRTKHDRAEVRSTTAPNLSKKAQLLSRKQKIATLRQSRSNRPPNIGGAVRRTPHGGRHRESEHFSELAL